MTTAYLHPALVGGQAYLAPLAAPQSVTLAASTSTQSATSSTGAATVTPSAQVVNLTGANSTQGTTSSTGAASVTPAAKTVNLVAANSTQGATSSTGVAGVVSGTNGGPAAALITVPASRTAVFAARSRVIVFTGTSPVAVAKVSADQLYFVADFTKDLLDGATLAQSVAPVVSGLTLLEGPTLQGSLCVVKIGDLDLSPRAVNSLTFRVTCVNGEVFDRTMVFSAIDDRSQVFGKDPDDKRFYAFDVSADLALSGNTTIAAVQPPTAFGVSALTVPVIQGGQAILKLGGLDTSNGPVNSCNLIMTLATTEVLSRTIYFSRQDH